GAGQADVEQVPGFEADPGQLLAGGAGGGGGGEAGGAPRREGHRAGAAEREQEVRARRDHEGRGAVEDGGPGVPSGAGVEGGCGRAAEGRGQVVRGGTAGEARYRGDGYHPREAVRFHEGEYRSV